MKKLLLSAALIATLPTFSLSDPKSDIEYIVSQTVTRDIFEGAIAAQRPLITSAFENDFRKKGFQVNDLEVFFDIVVDEWIDIFTGSMQSQTGAIYRSIFSDSELADISAFFKTESGQAYIQATPALMQSGAELGRRAGQESATQVMDRVKKRLTEEEVIISSPTLTQRLLDAL